MLKQIWQGRLGGLRLVMLFAALGLILVGLASIYSTAGRGAATKQLVLVGLASVGFLAVNLVPYQVLGRISYGLFGVAMLLLLLLLGGKYLHILPGLIRPIRGEYRWIDLGVLQFQPSEIAKLSYILALAWYLRHRKNYRRIKGLVGPFVLSLAPMLLIILERDLGTTMLFLPVLFAVLFVAGARVKHLLVIVALALLTAPLFYFLVMEDYQQKRILAWIKQDDTDDAYWLRNEGYQLRQSKICIATGQVTGQGWELSRFVRRKLPPDQHNDFIFAMIGHQWGLVGCLAVLLFYALIIVGGIEIAGQQSEPFGRLLTVGICALIAAQMFINVGMTLGLMPITGMTLPFVSYGGSSLLASFLALGLLVNVARHRPHQLAGASFEFGGA